MMVLFNVRSNVFALFRYILNINELNRFLSGQNADTYFLTICKTVDYNGKKRTKNVRSSGQKMSAKKETNQLICKELHFRMSAFCPLEKQCNKLINRLLGALLVKS